MGFMDGFTSDGTVDMKHTEYYNLMKEAAKAELLSNAVKAEVPGFYVQAMITGEKPECIATLEAKEENTGFHEEYELITGAVVTIFEAWMKENGVKSAATSLHRLIDTLAHNRIEELQTIKENQEEHNAQMEEMFKEMMEAMEKMPVITANIDFGCGKCHPAAGEPGEDGSKHPDRWSCEDGGHYKPNAKEDAKKSAQACKQCEDGSNFQGREDAAGQQEPESEGAKE
jgi:hypothetical protein